MPLPTTTRIGILLAWGCLPVWSAPLVTTVPRPWGDTFLPKSPAPAARLLFVDTTHCSREQRIALACLQGLTSREQPRLWLHFPWRDTFWLDVHVRKGYLEGYDPAPDWRTAFERFGEGVRGAVVPDSALYRGDLLAANVAACEDLIVASPELARDLGLEVRIDLRGRFPTYADGLEWLWETYGPRFSRHLCDYLHPQRLENGAFAYDYQWRAPMFWIAGTKDAAEPGADPERERALVSRILAAGEPNTAVIGFPYAGDGIGPGEVEGVGLAGRYGKPLVCTDALANACVTSGVRIPRPEQPAPLPAPPLRDDAIYIALALSDGDNQNTWINYFRPYFEHPRRGEFPVASGMGPPILDLMPAVAEWYFEHAPPGTEFLADVSGIGYIQPGSYGQACADPEATFEGFLTWTRDYMDRLGMRTLRTVGGEDDLLARYAAALPGRHSLFADMGRYSGREGIAKLTYSLPDGTPVFRAATSWRYGKEGFLREVREQVGTVRPAFVNGFLHCWTFRSFDDIVAIYDGRDADMVFVSPSQLADLYRAYCREGNSR